MTRPKFFLLVGGWLAAIAVGFGATSVWFARTHAGQSPQQFLAQIFIPAPQTVFGKDRLSVLILGIDYNYDERDIEFSKGARSDTIMAASLDFPTKTIRELSVPRDMDVILPDGSEDKINAAYSDGGVPEARTVIAKFLGLPSFDRYVVLRVDAARDLINAIGGVDLDVMNSDALRHQGPNGPVDYDDSWGHLHVHLKPGLQHLTGDQAVGYARFRHDWCSDPCRIMRQQQVIRAVVDTLEHHQLNTLVHVQDLLGVIRRDIQTDLTPQEELSLAMDYANIGRAAIKTEQIPYVADKDLPLAGDVIVPDEQAKTKLVAAMFGPEATPAPQAALDAIAANSIHVTVENGTGERGLATKVAQALQSRGFVVDDVRDADSFGYATTEILANSQRPLVADKVKSELGSLVAQPQIETAALTTTRSDVTVIVGHDYHAP